LYKGFPLHPDDEDDPLAFRIEFGGLGMATIPLQVVFSRHPDTGRVSVHVDLQSVSAQMQPARTNPRRRAAAVLALAAGALVGGRLHRGRGPDDREGTE
jgi:hypothetical protein